MALGDRRNVFRTPTVSVDFQLDAAGIRRIAVGSELAAACTAVVTTRALPYAVSISPTKRGNYKRSFKVDNIRTSEVGRPIPMLRVGTRLVNDAHHADEPDQSYATAIEVGNWVTGGKGQHILRRTLQSL